MSSGRCMGLLLSTVSLQPLMSSQLCCLGKIRAAALTNERLLACMRAHMVFKVVAPANKRAQKPHLKGFSWRWISTWAHKSWVVENDKGQCAHWKGFSEWRVHTWIWSKILWVKVLWHCLHFHTLISLSFVSLMSTFIVWSSAILSSFQPVLLKLLFSSNTCEFCWRTWPGWVASPSGSLRFWLEEYPLEMLK